jgi:hypothetical protein
MICILISAPSFFYVIIMNFFNNINSDPIRFVFYEFAKSLGRKVKLVEDDNGEDNNSEISHRK